MSTPRLKEYLLDLVKIPGPSGHEDRVAEYIKQNINSFVSQVNIDDMGNVIAIREGRSEGPRFMLTAHMDEVSMVVTRVEDQFVYFESVGTINKSISYSEPVKILTSSSQIPGVTCAPSVHLKQDLEEIWIDVGKRYQQIERGDPVVFDSRPRWLDDNETVLASKAVDDRAGCAILLALARELGSIELDAEIVFTFSVQEEISARGARYLVQHLKPDYLIGVDNNMANEPSESSKSTFPLGAGPVINRFEALKPDRGGFINFADQDLVEQLRASADSQNAQSFFDARFNVYSDAGGANEKLPTIKSTYVSAPRRYSHSPYEVTSLNGLEDTKETLLEYFQANW